MKNNIQKPVVETVCCVDNPDVDSEISASRPVTFVMLLCQILRDGAQKMLQAAIRKEIDEYLQDRTGIVAKKRRRIVIRNRSLPERELNTRLGPTKLWQHWQSSRWTQHIDWRTTAGCWRLPMLNWK
jgi:hypothetical protein